MLNTLTRTLYSVPPIQGFNATLYMIILLLLHVQGKLSFKSLVLATMMVIILIYIKKVVFPA